MRLEKVPVYEKNLARIHDWIRAVDQKLSIFVALQGVLIVFMTPLILNQIAKKYLYIDWQLYAVILIAYYLVGYGLFKCLLSLYSSLKVRGQSITEDQLSLTYFNHIQKMSVDTYKKKMRGLTKEIYVEELLSQVHVSACIATKKHRHFNDALFLFVTGTVAAIFGLCWLYVV